MHAGAQALGMKTPSPPQAWDPALYDRAASFVPKLASDLLELLAPKPGELVLDLGAGTGELSARIAERGATVLGLDASPEMVSDARRKHPALEFVHGDGQELSDRERFDAVFSNATLHWMPRALDVARGVMRALKPGGRFVAEFGGKDCVATLRRAVAVSLRELELPLPGTPDWYFPSVGEHA